MFSKNSKKLLAVVSLALLITSTAASRPRKPQRLSAGAWGGQQIRLNVASGSATIDYACAHGTIDGPLNIDSKGRFKWRGTHSPERGGPIRVDEQSNSHPASYTGTVKGDTMTLTVRANNKLVDTFTLTLGGSGRLFKCR